MIYRRNGHARASQAGVSQEACGRGKTNRKCWVNMNRGVELGMGLAGAKVRLVD